MLEMEAKNLIPMCRTGDKSESCRTLALEGSGLQFETTALERL